MALEELEVFKDSSELNIVEVAVLEDNKYGIGFFRMKAKDLSEAIKIYKDNGFSIIGEDNREFHMDGKNSESLTFQVNNFTLNTVEDIKDMLGMQHEFKHDSETEMKDKKEIIVSNVVEISILEEEAYSISNFTIDADDLPEIIKTLNDTDPTLSIKTSDFKLDSVEDITKISNIEPVPNQESKISKRKKKQKTPKM